MPKKSVTVKRTTTWEIPPELLEDQQDLEANGADEDEDDDDLDDDDDDDDELGEDDEDE